MEKINVETRYFVMERGKCGCLYSGTLEDCRKEREKIKNRNENDGYDEYWNNADLVIVERIDKIIE